MYKNQFYILIYDLLYFYGRNEILLLVAQKKEVSKLLYEFYDEICTGNFARQIIVEKILIGGYYWLILFNP
jgi:hypothetical protein